MNINIILIDAQKREVKTESHSADDLLKVMQDFIGDYIEIAHTISGKSRLFVGETARLRTLKCGFSITGSPYDYFLGNGVIAAYEEGEPIDCDHTEFSIAKDVKWVDLNNVSHAINYFKILF